MAEPYFPPPPKKESAPFRTPAVLPSAAPIARRTMVTAPAPPPKREPQAKFVEVTSDDGPVAASFLVRFGVRVAALAIALGLLYVLGWASEGGAKWPQAILLALAGIAILGAPILLFVRVRNFWRSL